jgi:hypothetical protein
VAEEWREEGREEGREAGGAEKEGIASQASSLF